MLVKKYHLIILALILILFISMGFFTEFSAKKNNEIEKPKLSMEIYHDMNMFSSLPSTFVINSSSEEVVSKVNVLFDVFNKNRKTSLDYIEGFSANQEMFAQELVNYSIISRILYRKELLVALNDLYPNFLLKKSGNFLHPLLFSISMDDYLMLKEIIKFLPKPRVKSIENINVKADLLIISALNCSENVIKTLVEYPELINRKLWIENNEILSKILKSNCPKGLDYLLKHDVLKY